MLHVHIKVKFRAFFVTFGVVERDFAVPLPAPIPPKVWVTMSERGVDLLVETV